MVAPRGSAIVGAAELEWALKKLGEKIGNKVLDAALRAGARPIVKEAKRLVPVRSGELKRSITVRKATKRQRRRGFGEIFIGFRGEVSRRAHLSEFGTVHSRADPFMRPALDAKAQEAIDIVGKQIGSRVEKAAAELAGKAPMSRLTRRRRR